MAARREELGSRLRPALARARSCEPRGHDALVGALLTPPVSRGAVAGVVFFDNVGPLWMCGHGTIGVVRTLEHLGRIGPGAVRLDTAVGPVGAELSIDGVVTIENVPARVPRPGRGRGGARPRPRRRATSRTAATGSSSSGRGAEAVEPANRERLRTATLAIQRALARAGRHRGRGRDRGPRHLLSAPSRQ